MPSHVALNQNHPNPFSGTTLIEYEIARRELVHLYVTDMLGRKVATLVDALVEPGKYRVSFDASSLAGGVYFSVLNATSGMLMKLMAVAK